jgi:hypothetical protein
MPLKTISDANIAWFNKQHDTGFIVSRKALHNVIKNQKIPNIERKQLQECFPELSQYRIDDEQHMPPNSYTFVNYSNFSPSEKPIIIYGEYEGINQDDGMAAIQGKKYFISSYNPMANPKELKIQIHGVTFIHPSGFFGLLPSGSLLISPIFEFPDGTIEHTAKIQDKGSSVQIQAGYSGNNRITTVLSHHQHPQAGVTVWKDPLRIKFLVSTE